MLLVNAFQQRHEKVSPPLMQQLHCIGQFSTNIVHIPGEENAVADVLSRVCTFTTPTRCEAQAEPNADLPIEDAKSLKIQPLQLEGVWVLCDVSSGVMLPYLPVSLRRVSFKVVRGSSHPSDRETCRQLKVKFIWPGTASQDPQPNNIGVPEALFTHVHLDFIAMPALMCYYRTPWIEIWPTVLLGLSTTYKEDKLRHRTSFWEDL